MTRSGRSSALAGTGTPIGHRDKGREYDVNENLNEELAKQTYF